LEITLPVFFVVAYLSFLILFFYFSHYKEKVSTVSLFFFFRFTLSNTYIFFLIFLPDFSILIDSSKTLRYIDSFLTLSFVVATTTTGILRTDLESKRKLKQSLVDRFFDPPFAVYFFVQMLFIFQSATVYAIRLYSPDTIYQNVNVFGFLQLATMFFNLLGLITMVATKRLLNPSKSREGKITFSSSSSPTSPSQPSPSREEERYGSADVSKGNNSKGKDASEEISLEGKDA